MRILLLCPYPPYPPRSGGALRVRNLLGGLARNHDVTCLTFAPDAAARAALAPLHAQAELISVPTPPARSLAQRARAMLTAPLPDLAQRNASPAYAAALRELLTTRRWDVVQAESLEMAPYGLLAATASTGHPRPLLVLDEFNAEYVLQRRAALTDLQRLPRPRPTIAAAYSLVQWARLAAYERDLLRRYDHVLAVSDDDRRALRRLVSGAPHAPVSIVPNGVDNAYFAPPAHPPAPPLDTRPALLFTGTLDFRPNVDAVLWFAHHVLPLVRQAHPDVRFLVVGRTPGPAVRALHDGNTVIVAPDVPDVRPYMAAAAAYVVPMRMGGGVRLKLLEALAMQCAVVSTRMGASGVPELLAGTHLLLADSPELFAAALLRLLADSDLRTRLGQAGRALVQADYDWQVIAPRLERVYQTGTIKQTKNGT